MPEKNKTNIEQFKGGVQEAHDISKQKMESKRMKTESKTRT